MCVKITEPTIDINIIIFICKKWGRRDLRRAAVYDDGTVLTLGLCVTRQKFLASLLGVVLGKVYCTVLVRVHQERRCRRAGVAHTCIVVSDARTFGVFCCTRRHKFQKILRNLLGVVKKKKWNCEIVTQIFCTKYDKNLSNIDSYYQYNIDTFFFPWLLPPPAPLVLSCRGLLLYCRWSFL